MQYYTRRYIRDVSGASDALLDRWSRKLRDTPMIKKEGYNVLFSEDFATFIGTRVGAQGPPNLPEPERIATLLQLWRETDGDSEQISTMLGEPQAVIKAQLMAVLGNSHELGED